ncbi:MAG: hypothetical protein DRQ13_00250 [Ignavibacteriae bacterium]|nr:MAG: hypothetical protein DRQ13_00250 [Ignavibacteriota bacterium]
MEANKDILEMILTGEGIKPDSLKASEVADLISAYEHSLLSIIARENPKADLDDTFISLIDIQENSAHFKFKPKAKELFISAALIMNTALNTNQLESLPYKSVESLNKIWLLSKRKNCTTEFTSSEEIPKAQITPENEIKISGEFFYQGATNIYGVIERVGGTVPRVRIRLDDNSIIYVELNQNLAKAIAKNLYETVGLKGIARWRKEDFAIEDFEVEEILFYKDTTNELAFNELRKVVGSYWDEVPDASEYLNKIRYGEE